MRPSLAGIAAALFTAGCATAGESSVAEPDHGRRAGSASAHVTPSPFDASKCTFDGHALYGKMKVVTALADVKVKVVEAFPDLRVEKVSALADACGKWEMVDGIADTTIEFVTAFPDVRVQFVTAFPGIP